MPADKDNNLEKIRHTATHILAAASRQLKPETRLGIGPATADGFFHDIDVDKPWREEDLKQLQKEMQKIINKNYEIAQREISKNKARELFKNDPYKLELIEEIKGDEVGVSDIGDGFFVTLCEGGHVKSTGEIKAFKLTNLAGVYWQGDENKPQLQRIYGLAFASKEELKKHEALLAEAKKRDHRKLGQQLGLFTFSPLVGPGLPLFTPRGTVIRRELEEFVQSLQEPRGYQRVMIPHIAKADLYKTSGHWEKFKADLFRVSGASKEELVMKPMNCPHHTQIYASQKRSYKELPVRYSEVTTVYRDEQTGELQGLSRVRSITQDDAHVFCRLDQVEAEIEIIYDIVEKFYKAFGFKLAVRLSAWNPEEPDNYLGEAKVWEESQNKLRAVLNERKVEFIEQVGEAAFYGPKIDFVARDSLKREWQLATIQLDFNMPEKFNLTYTSEDGTKQPVIMIHRAILGSVERFMAILLEHYAGHLPLWLSPVQVSVLPITDEQISYSHQVLKQLLAAGIRADIDERSESIGKKIREAELMKIPVMLIIGQKEVEENKVSIRRRDERDEGVQKLDEAIRDLTKMITARE